MGTEKGKGSVVGQGTGLRGQEALGMEGGQADGGLAKRMGLQL